MFSLDEDKLRECQIIFDSFDKDKDNKIGVEYLEDCLRVCGAAPTQQQLETIFQNLQETGNKLIDFQSFLFLLDKILKDQDTEEDIINKFKKLDKLDNGTISEKDLRHLLSDFENSLSNEDIEEIIQDANVDENGYINIEKFTKILLGNE